jgi:hypothetical protein
VSVEYWIMRLVPREDIRSGLVEIGGASGVQFVNGDYVIPIDVESDQEVAMRRALEEHAKTGVPHKVVMSADVP